MAHYKITPLEKKSISITYEMFRENADGTISWFNVEDHYRWGAGFIAEDMDVNLEHDQARSQHCKAEYGEYEGCEFDDQVACWFEFSDDIGEEEQEEIKRMYLEGDDDGRGGAGWIHEGDHEWQIEDDYVIVMPPYKVELCEADGTVIREVKTRTLEESIELGKKLGDGWYVSPDAGKEPEKWK